MERIAPYRPSIDKGLAKLFEKSISEKQEKPASTLVDWSFLDKDNGQPGEPAEWVKKQIRMYEKWKDDIHAEMLEDLKNSHKWTRNIEPPASPKRYDPNEPLFIPPTGFFDDMEEDDL